MAAAVTLRDLDLEASPEVELRGAHANTRLAWVQLGVAPSQRERGLGRWLEVVRKHLSERP